MKKLLTLFTMLLLCIASTWADVQTDFVSVVNAIDGSVNLDNDHLSKTLENGTVMSFALGSGKLWAQDECNTEWNNTGAVSELNSILGKDLSASDYFPKAKANRNGHAGKTVTCTANLSNTDGYDPSKIVTFYVALYTQAPTSTPSLSVSGFSPAEYQYALANGNGFTTVGSVSEIPCATQDYTLVKIKGKLSATGVASVTFSATNRSGVQWMAIKYNEIATVENTYTYYLGENEIASFKHEDVVYSAPTGALSLPSYATLESTTAPEICGSEPATFKYYTQENEQLPFKTDGTYYNLALNRNPNLQIYATEGVTNEIQTQDVARTIHTQYYYMWSFEGDWYHGYAIKNRAADAYVSYGTTANPNDKTKATLVTEKEVGSYFDLTIQGGYNYFPIHGTTNNAYISNNGGTTTTYLTNWNSTENISKSDPGAQVIITEAVEIEYDRTELNNAIAKAQSYVGYIGTGVGQYQGLTPGELSESIASAQSFLENTNQTEIDAATAALNNALAKLTLNMPVDGHYYTLQGVVGDNTHGNKQYMIGATVSVQKDGQLVQRLVLSAEPEGYNNVFQYVDGKLLSVTADRYVVNNAGFLNLGDADAEGVAIEFTPSTAVGTYLVKFRNGNTDRCTWSRFEGYIDGADYYADREEGYQWNIVEVPASNITYQITEGGTVKWHETIKAVIGYTYPAPTFSHPFVSALAGVPDGTVQDDKTIQLTYTTKYDIAPDVSNINKYYALDIHATSGHFPMYSDGQVLRKETTSIDLSEYAQGSADHIYAWAFVGNIFDGIKLYNKEDQKYVCQSADNSNTQVSMTKDPDVATAFTVYPNANVATAFSLKKSDFSNYLNTRGGFVCGWTSADGGSAIRAYEISEFTDATADLFDRMKNTAKFNLVEGAVVVSPREYDEPSKINAAIDAANDLSESATLIEKKNFITDDPSGQKLYKFLVESDNHGDPVVVTYVQNRPYGTLILPLNFKCPTGWTRYYCSELTEGGRLVLTEFTGGETKNRPFIIYSPETIGTTYQFIGYSGGALTEDVKIGLLTGVLSNGGTIVPQGSYVLAYHKETGVQSFRRTDGTVVCPQYKVYLTKSALAESRDNFYFPDVDDSATGLEELLEQSVLADGKYVRDGRVIIVKNGVKYNTNGQIIK